MILAPSFSRFASSFFVLPFCRVFVFCIFSSISRLALLFTSVCSGRYLVNTLLFFPPFHFLFYNLTCSTSCLFSFLSLSFLLLRHVTIVLLLFLSIISLWNILPSLRGTYVCHPPPNFPSHPPIPCRIMFCYSVMLFVILCMLCAFFFFFFF